MGKARTKAEDSRKPKHSRDASRPSKGGKGQRDAATVCTFGYAQSLHTAADAAWANQSSLMCSHSYDKADKYAGSKAQNVQQDSKEGQGWKDHTSGKSLSSCFLGAILTMPEVLKAQGANTHTGLQDLQSKDLPNTRIQPDRRWFGNTRVIGQKQLDQFRDEMSAKVSSIYVDAFTIHVLFCHG